MKNRSFTRATLLTVLLLGSEFSVLAADTLRPLEVDDYFALKNVGNPVISPDGDIDQELAPSLSGGQER